MTTWFTADLHLGHRNIIGYCNRPFHDVESMNDALIENWNNAVGQDDTVWVVRDFALARIADTLPLVSTLHGRKILLAGNPRPGEGVADRRQELVGESATLTRSISTNFVTTAPDFLFADLARPARCRKAPNSAGPLTCYFVWWRG